MDVPKTWKDIPGFPGYQVSDQGDVRSFWQRYGGRRLGQSYIGFTPQRIIRAHQGTLCLQVNLRRNGAHCLGKVHQLVLTAFVCPRPAGLQGCHEDGDFTHNWLENLRWGTKSSNEKDKVRHGRCNFAVKGTAHPGYRYHFQKGGLCPLQSTV